MNETAVLAYAHINARIMPDVRGSFYEDPLRKALEQNGFGAVTGAVTSQSKSGEIEYCGLDVEIFDLEKGVPFICEFLAERGAPRGSNLQFKYDDDQIEIEFGELEGLAIYFNGNGLPDEVYEQYNINDVHDEINHLINGRGQIQGHQDGLTETVMYLYGHSVEEMCQLITPLMESNPLCENARVVTIA